MIRFDHLAVNVSDLDAAKAWYVSVLGLEIEFDTPAAVGLQDDADFTLILATGDAPATGVNLYFQVDSVDAAYRDLLARGVRFLYPPQPNDWGYGAGLLDPDGRLVGLWDQESMARHMAAQSGSSP
jgi:catechol 2,3-dioxygenase-like lactoylglutathione lyase family enzyme